MLQTRQQFEESLTIKIEQDVDPHSPREDDNLGTFHCWHRRYNLGDENHTADDRPEDILEDYKDGEVLSVYMYEHGGITIRTSPFSCPWDSGQLGFIAITKEKIIEEYGDDSPETRERVRGYLDGEIKTYDQYLTGDVWTYSIDGPGVDDSCCGFYGREYAEEEAQNTIQYYYDRYKKNYLSRLKTLIRHRVPLSVRNAELNTLAA